MHWTSNSRYMQLATMLKWPISAGQLEKEPRLLRRVPRCLSSSIPKYGVIYSLQW